MSTGVRRLARGVRQRARAAGIAAAAAARDDVDVLGLADEAVLASIAEHRARAARAQVDELAAVAVWADRHRLTDPEDWTALGSISVDGQSMAEDLLEHPERQPQHTATAGALGIEGVLRLGGEGAFGVREFAVTDLAVLLGMSEPAARAYVGQTVELRDRLPRLWAQVMAGVLPVWKARRIAEHTIALSAEAAAFVDAQLEAFAHRLSITRILRCVDAAILRFHPDLARRRAEAAAETRGVWLEDDTTEGTTRIEATVDTPDAHAFDRTLEQTATALSALGDASPRQVRRARALGVLADPQYTLDLHTTAKTTKTATIGTETVGIETVDAPAKLRRTAASPMIHLHLHTGCGCETPSDTGQGAAVTGLFGPVTRVHPEGLGSWRPGPAPTAAVGRWLAGLTPGTQVTVTPVVDLAGHIAVDAYEHPAGLVRQVAERDLVCQFPWCARTGAAYDLDHIQPYRDPGQGGPPGQTSTVNTARLCRYHHRVKTHGAWDYRRTGPTAVTWTSPQGRTYTVDHTGTHPH
jgi:hypothetical protein